MFHAEENTRRERTDVLSAHTGICASMYLWQPVSPPMQRVAVSGDDLGLSLPLRLVALCVIHF